MICATLNSDKKICDKILSGLNNNFSSLSIILLLFNKNNLKINRWCQNCHKFSVIAGVIDTGTLTPRTIIAGDNDTGEQLSHVSLTLVTIISLLIVH
jgi:hypothetical protein